MLTADSLSSAQIEKLVLETDISSSDELKKRDWRNVVFTIFNPFWMITIDLTIFINCFTVMYSNVYERNVSTSFTIVYYGCELCFLIDTFLAFLHRYWKDTRQRLQYKPRRVALLVLDVLTLFPYYECYLLLTVAPPKDRTRLKVVPRFIILWAHVFSGRSIIDHFSGIYSIIIKQLFVITSASLLFSTIWYMMACTTLTRGACLKETWSDLIKAHMINAESTIDWFLVSCCTMINVLLQNLAQIIRPVNTTETFFVILVALIGFFTNVMYFVSRVMANYTHEKVDYYSYLDKLKNIQVMLGDWNASEQDTKEVIHYSKQLWELRYGVKFMPVSFQLLPTSLKKDIALDLFWDALRHTHFFNDVSFAFKKEIAMLMKNEFLLPGEYLFRADDIKKCLVYIESGDLQILSEEDKCTPIMNFTAGTVIGEINCMMWIRSPVNVRCATKCELHILELTTFLREMAKTRFGSKELHAAVSKRIENAKTIIRFKNSLIKSYETIEEKYTKPIKRLKNNWRIIWNTTINSDVQQGVQMMRYVDGTYCSNFMSHLVLSEVTKVEVKAVCLTNSCPYVMDPDSSFRKLFYTLSLVAALIYSIILPFLMAFKLEMSKEIFAIMFALDVLYWIEFYMFMLTADERSSSSMTASQVVFSKLNKLTLLLDLLSCLPLDYLFYTFDLGYMAIFFKVARMLKLYRVFIALMKWEESPAGNPLVKRFVKYISFYGYAAYFGACILFIAACPGGACKQYSWYQRTIINVPDEDDVWHKFWFSLNLSLSLIVRTNHSNSPINTLVDMIVCTGLTFIGCFLFVFCISECACAGLQVNIMENLYNEKLKNLKQVLLQSKANTFLNKRINYHLDFRWYHKRFLADEHINLEDMPVDVRQDVQYNRIIASLKKIAFFCVFSEETLRYVASVCEFRVLQPRCVVCSKGHFTPCIYVLERGVCRFYSSVVDSPPNVKYVRAPAAFPIIETLYKVPSLLTVITVTSVVVITVPASMFLNIIRMYNVTFLRDVLESFEISDYPIYQNRNVGKFKSREHKLDYTIEKPKSSQEFVQLRRKQGQRNFISYITFSKTMSPHSRLYIGWEIFRCIIILLQFYVSILCLSTYFIHTKSLVPIQYFYDIIGLIDIYIKFHVQYYNKDGIVVTHPTYTAKNYMTTSFIIDLISVFPIHLLEFDIIFARKESQKQFYHIHIMITRTLQMYRVIGAMNFVMKVSGNVLRTIARIFKVTILTLIMYLVCMTVVYLYTCSINESVLEDPSQEPIKCDPHVYITHLYILPVKQRTPDAVRRILQYILTMLFTLQSSKILELETTSEIQVFMPVIILTALTYYYMVTYFLSKTISGYFQVIENRNMVNNLWQFARRENVEVEIVDQIIAEFEFQWTSNYGIDVCADVDILDYVLRYRVLETFYGDVMAKVPLFADRNCYFIRTLLLHMNSKVFIKGAKIIQINDVQNKLYVIFKGTVKVSVGNDTICYMGPSSVFGSLAKKGYTRQTVNITAEVHVSALYIEASVFETLIKEFPQLWKQIKIARFLNQEYITPEDNSRRSREVSIISSVAMISDFGTSRYFIKCIKAMNIWIESHQKFMRTAYIIFYIFFTPYYLIALILLITFTYRSQLDISVLLVFGFITDVFFWLRMVLEMIVPKVDPSSGLLVTNPKTLRLKYFHSHLFYVDIITLFPVDVLMWSIYGGFHIVGYLNKFLRIVFFITYYINFNKTLYMKTAYKIYFLVYVTILYMISLSSIWIILSCSTNTVCTYAGHSGSNRIMFTTTDFNEILMRGLFYATNTLTNAALSDLDPLTMVQLDWYTYLSFTSPFMVILLLCNFANIFNGSNYAEMRYALHVSNLMNNLKRMNLSPALAHKAKLFFSSMWWSSKGETLPAILSKTPSYLKENIMGYVYGHHLRNHFLFSESHEDFLRQLVPLFQRVVLLPTYRIVNQGDRDQSMYFIHSGEVQAKSILRSGEVVVYMLREGSSFGEGPGLFNIPHKATYTCQTMVDVLLLKKEVWCYLLKWFPASMEKILEKAKEYRVEGALVPEIFNSFKVENM